MLKPRAAWSKKQKKRKREPHGALPFAVVMKGKKKKSQPQGPDFAYLREKGKPLQFELCDPKKGKREIRLEDRPYAINH